MFDIYLQPNTEVYFTNNTYVNISGLFGGAYIYNTDKVYMTGNTILNSTNFGFGLISFEETGSVTIDDFLISNVVASGTSAEYILYVLITNGEDLYINKLKMVDSEVNEQSLVYLNGPVTNFTLKNSTFENVLVGSEISMFTLTEVYFVTISDLIFTGIDKSDSSDTDNFMINIGTLHLDGKHTLLLNTI